MYAAKTTLATLLVLATWGGYPEGSGVIIVGDEHHYINYTPAQKQEQSDSEYIIRLGSGSYQGTATARVVLKIDSQGNQVVDFVSIDKTKPINIGGEIDNGDPDPPVDEGTTARSKAVADQIGDPETAQKLVVAYFTVTAIKDQYNSVQEISDAANQITDSVIANNQVVDQWQPWKVFYQQEFTRIDQEVNIDTVNEYASVLDGMRQGLMQSAGGSANLGVLDLQEILEIVQGVFELIQERPIDWAKAFEIAIKVIRLLQQNQMQVEGSF